jgi:hypothetical protein
MKRLSLILALVTLTISSLSAQQVVKKRIGTYTESGNLVVAEANTVLAVDITLSYEEFVAGPYARYAQKYMGTRASQVDYAEYSIVGAEVAVAADDYYMTDANSNAAAESLPFELTFGDVLPDKMSTNVVATEDAAKSAAEKIFELRRVRLELVCGDLGDGVYGAGLESALREIDAIEKSYLELFYGKRESRTFTRRIYVSIDPERKSQVVARFNADQGLLSSDNLSGDIVMVTIQPSEMEYPASNPKGKATYRYANNATIVITLGQQVLNNRVLPVYEYGATVTL